MDRKNHLFEIADRQQGFFTAKQAEKCGYARSNFHLRLVSGEWIQEGRGVYRLGRYPVTERPELVLWSLWSRNREDIPQGVWSHETALDIHELSDVMTFKSSIQKVYKARGTHVLSEILESPPLEWVPLYESLAAECGLKLTMSQAYRELNDFFQALIR